MLFTTFDLCVYITNHFTNTSTNTPPETTFANTFTITSFGLHRIIIMTHKKILRVCFISGTAAPLMRSPIPA